MQAFIVSPPKIVKVLKAMIGPLSAALAASLGFPIDCLLSFSSLSR